MIFFFNTELFGRFILRVRKMMSADQKRQMIDVNLIYFPKMIFLEIKFL